MTEQDLLKRLFKILKEDPDFLDDLAKSLDEEVVEWVALNDENWPERRDANDSM